MSRYERSASFMFIAAVMINILVWKYVIKCFIFNSSIRLLLSRSHFLLIAVVLNCVRIQGYSHSLLALSSL